MSPGRILAAAWVTAGVLACGVVSSPVEEANWQTNVFLERLDATQTAEERLVTLAENLGQQGKYEGQLNVVFDSVRPLGK